MSTNRVYSEPVPSGWGDGLDVAAVLAGQGIDATSRGARLPALRDTAARALSEGRALLAPAVASRLLRVERSRLDELVLEKGWSIRGEAPARRLSGSLHVLVAVCTVGDACDRRAAGLMLQDPAFALAFDGLATAAVNQLAAAVCHQVRDDAARTGQRTAPPISPGQGEWDLLEGQRLVFDAVEPGRIGVRLSDGGQMQPCKSVSFAVGIGPTVDDRAPGACAGCSSRPGCHYTELRKDW